MRWYQRFFRRGLAEKHLDAELRFHLEQRIADLVAGGMAPEEARRQARIEFGGLDQVKEECRDVGASHVIETIAQDIRYGLRQLRRNPGFTAVAVLTLALGIGANTAIFSLVDAFALRPLPVKDPGRLTVIAVQSGADSDPGQISYPDYLVYHRYSSEFASMTCYDLEVVGLGYNGHADRILASYVPSNFFEMLGLRPALGRLIQLGEGDQPGTSPVVVLGYDYWQKRFGGDSRVVGQTVTLDGRPVTVIGVAPKKFQGPYALIDMSAYAPIGMINHGPNFFSDRRQRDLRVLGTLKPNVSVRRAQANLQVIADRLAQKYPEADKGQFIRVFPERISRPEPAVAEYMPLVATVFLVLVGLVLLVACFNVANLLLARAAARDKETAVRAALGAGRIRLVRQMLTESILLAVAGGIGGVIAGRWIVGTFQGLRPVGGFPIDVAAPFDWRVFGYVAAAVLLAGILAGVGASMRVMRANPHDVLHEAGRGVIGHRSRSVFRNTLVAAQIAISLVVLVAAGLFIRSLVRVQSINLGFNPRHVLNAGFDPKLEGYDEARTTAFCRMLLRQARALPGVKSASLAYSVPDSYYNDGSSVYAEGQSVPPEARAPGAELNSVSPDYFTTMGMHILEGRAFTDADTAKSLPVAIVNQTMAKRFWPHKGAVGRRFSYQGPAGPWVTVVGVLQDVRVNGLIDKPGMMFYAPETQLYRAIHVLQLRTSVAPDSLEPEVESLFRGLDPNMPVYDVMSMEDSLQGANGFFLFKMAAVIVAALGSLGLVLAAVGLYGVISFGASRRTHEIGIRMALGARKNDVLRMVIGQGLKLALIGVVIGIAGALALTRFLSSLLYGVKPTDPLTFVAVSLILIAVALLACYIPARRATKVDPMVALRYE